MRKIRITRDSAIFVSGLAILFHETVLSEAPSERPQLLIIAAMMIGLPAFLRKDENRPETPPKVQEPNGSGGAS